MIRFAASDQAPNIVPTWRREKELVKWKGSATAVGVVWPPHGGCPSSVPLRMPHSPAARVDGAAPQGHRDDQDSHRGGHVHMGAADLCLGLPCLSGSVWARAPRKSISSSRPQQIAVADAYGDSPGGQGQSRPLEAMVSLISVGKRRHAQTQRRCIHTCHSAHL